MNPSPNKEEYQRHWWSVLQAQANVTITIQSMMEINKIPLNDKVKISVTEALMRLKQAKDAIEAVEKHLAD